MKINLFAKTGRFALSVKDGEEIGETIINALKSYEDIVVDFQGVELSVRSFVAPMLKIIYESYPNFFEGGFLDNPHGKNLFINLNNVNFSIIKYCADYLHSYETDDVFRKLVDETTKIMLDNFIDDDDNLDPYGNGTFVPSDHWGRGCQVDCQVHNQQVSQ